MIEKHLKVPDVHKDGHKTRPECVGQTHKLVSCVILAGLERSSTRSTAIDFSLPCRRSSSHLQPHGAQRFPPPRVSLLCFFCVQRSKTQHTRSSLGGVQTFSGGCVVWCIFLPHRFSTPPPPMSWAQLSGILKGGSLGQHLCRTKIGEIA